MPFKCKIPQAWPVLAAALLAPVASALDLSIVHWNDVHARNTPATESGQQLCLENPYDDPACYGGHARIATLCKAEKAKNPNTLCVDGGDEFLGTAWDIIFQGQQNVDVLAAVGTDVMAVGNHEFDYGVSTLAAFVDAVPFPVIGACNMDLSAEPSLAGIQKWAVFDLPAGKVALLGYIAEDTAGLSSTGGVTFSDPRTAVPACFEEFMASPDSEGVVVVGLLSHAGLRVDEEVAALVPGAKFVVSAHSHTPMFPGLLGECLELADGTCATQDESTVPYPFISSGTPILQQFFASKYTGVAALSFDDGGALTGASGESIPNGLYYPNNGTSDAVMVEADPEVRALLEEDFAEVVAFSETEVAALPVALSAARPDIRVQEMPIGNAICDAMLQALADQGVVEDPEAPLICLTNGGGIRADLPAGTITFGDVTAVLPFGNTIEVLAIDGATLKAALEFAYDSADNLQDPPGKYAHLGGGLTVVYDLSQPAGARLVSVQHDCVEVADTDMFQLATNNFVAAGGDDFTFFVDLERVLLFGPGLSDAFAAFLGDNTPPGGTVPEELIDLEGRIVDVADVESAACPLEADGGALDLAPEADLPPGMYGG